MSKIKLKNKVRMKSVIFIVLVLMTMFSANLNGGLVYSADQQSLCSLLSDSDGNQVNENIYSDEDTAFFSSSSIVIPSISGLSGRLDSNAILRFAGTIFQPPEEAVI